MVIPKKRLSRGMALSLLYPRSIAIVPSKDRLARRLAAEVVQNYGLLAHRARSSICNLFPPQLRLLSHDNHILPEIGLVLVDRPAAVVEAQVGLEGPLLRYFQQALVEL